MLGEPTLYAAYLFGTGEAASGPSYGVEAEVGLAKSLSDGGGTLLLIALQPTYFFDGAVGYRLSVHANVAVRLQVNYRRWIDRERNELSGAVLFGLVVP